MSRNKKNIAIYSNLPSGGASVLALSNYNYLRTKSNIYNISDDKFQPANLLSYLAYAFWGSSKVHKELITKVPNDTEVLIAYHSWITKSPYILRYLSIPKIYICHEPLREYYDKMHISIQTFKEKIINILRLPIKYIDKKNIKSKKLTVIVNSNFSKKNIDKIYGISSIVVYPGIDISEFSNKKIQKKYQIISVGAINPLKGFDTIIKAIGHINKRIRPKLVLVGNGSADNYCNYLFKLAKVCKVDLKIKINISKSELKKEYASSKIFAYAPHNEPFGIVVQEAMASNLPIVVYGKGGGYTEIIDQKNGYIINDRSEKKWASAFTELLRNSKKINSIGKYNHSLVSRKYNSDIMNNKIWNIIKSL